MTPAARRFSRAAHSYDGAAALQRRVADRLLTRLPAELVPRCVVDAGCGTGHVTRALAQRYPGAELTGLDLSPAMLAQARAADMATVVRWLQGDIEALPLAAGSVDLLVSSMTLQWCTTPAAFLAEAARVLRPGGVLAFTTLLEGSLAELAGVDGAAVNAFIAPEALQARLDAVPFVGLTACDDLHRCFYPRPLALLRELSATGATTLMTSRRRGLAGRRRLAGWLEGLERQRTPQGIPLGWHIAHRVMRRTAATG